MRPTSSYYKIPIKTNRSITRTNTEDYNFYLFIYLFIKKMCLKSEMEHAFLRGSITFAVILHLTKTFLVFFLFTDCFSFFSPPVFLTMKWLK